MTKFQNPSFNSPANNSNYRDNYDRIFGKRSGKKQCITEGCNNEAWIAREHCANCLEEMGVEIEKPETD